MDVKRIADAAEVLGWLADRASELPEDRQKGVEMQMHLVMATTYLSAYVQELSDGKDPYDALRTAALGTTPLKDSPGLTVFKLLMSKPRPDGPA